MLKRMKKVYDTEFYEVDNEWGWYKERFYEISSNENEINLVTKRQSTFSSSLSRLECTLIFNIRWDDDLGLFTNAKVIWDNNYDFTLTYDEYIKE